MNTSFSRWIINYDFHFSGKRPDDDTYKNVIENSSRKTSIHLPLQIDVI